MSKWFLQFILSENKSVKIRCNEDAQLMQAISNKKLNDAEQACSSLIRYADEGLKALDSLTSFNGNPSPAMSCKQAVQFYKKTAEKKHT